MNQSPEAATRGHSLRGLWLIAWLWPLIVAAVIILAIFSKQLWRPGLSNDELALLLDAHRYTIQIPDDADKAFLSLEAAVDGKPLQSSAGYEVRGGTNVILLLRRSKEDGKVICRFQFANGNSGSTVIDDPLTGVPLTAQRENGPCQSGDWLFRGDNNSLFDSGPASYELRVELKSPDKFHRP